MSVSVVIASDNHAPFLAEAMESAIGQSMPGVELVVVDCGSSDRSLAVAETVVGANPEAAIELVSQPQAHCAAHARNHGVEVSRGDYIVCLDPYDRLAPDFVEHCAAALDAHPEAGFAYTDQIRFGATNGYEAVPDYDFDALIRDNFLGLVALFRRSAWEEAGGFDPEIPYDDWDFWIGCAEHGNHGVKVSGTAWHHRMRTNGRFRGDALPEVRRTRAALVRKRPQLYSAGQQAWADVVLTDDPDLAGAAAGAENGAAAGAENGVAEVVPLPRRTIRTAGPGDLVFHIGAGDGELTGSYLERGSRVVAVEPDPIRARRLRNRFGHSSGLTVIEKAAGSWEGAHEPAWPQPMLVQMTTLARLIDRHGEPAFCKVDPESFADHVLAGLDRPLPCVSFRFNARTLREARVCAWRLAALGMTEFNYTLCGDDAWASKDWIGTKGLYLALDELEREGFGWADAYARPRRVQPSSSGAIVRPAELSCSQ